jgi:hypothetical protein
MPLSIKYLITHTSLALRSLSSAASAASKRQQRRSRRLAPAAPQQAPVIEWLEGGSGTAVNGVSSHLEL